MSRCHFRKKVEKSAEHKCCRRYEVTQNLIGIHSMAELSNNILFIFISISENEDAKISLTLSVYGI